MPDASSRPKSCASCRAFLGSLLAAELSVLQAVAQFFVWERVPTRRQAEAETLASLTGGSPASIRERMGKDAPKPPEPRTRSAGSDGVASRAQVAHLFNRLPWLTTCR